MLNLSVRVVKELKGAPLSVLMALMFAGKEAANQAWVARNTGYTDKSVRQALDYLVEHGFVIRTGRGWMISDGSGQIALQIPPEVAYLELDHPCVDPDNFDLDDQIRNNSGSPISIVNKVLKDSNDSVNTNNECRNNSDKSPQFSAFPEIGQALMDAGIRENARTRRLLGRISPRDVRTTVAKIRDDPLHDLSETGLMVTILEGVAQRNEHRGGYESWNT
ncbi:hypothetical protein ACFLXI_05220 [Chloroflexota bacterium]